MSILLSTVRQPFNFSILFKYEGGGDFPGGPVVKDPRFHCRGHEFDPWSGELRSCML